MRRSLRLYRKTNNGDVGTELEANTLPVLAGALEPEFIESPIKRARVPNSTQTHFPAPAGLVETDFIKKLIKGAPVPNSRQTHWPVLASVVDTDFIKNK